MTHLAPGRLCGLQAEESELNGRLQAGQAGVHAALCDNIDTARALIQLSELVTAVNKYLARRPLPHGAPPDGAPAHHQHRAPPRARPCRPQSRRWSAGGQLAQHGHMLRRPFVLELPVGIEHTAQSTRDAGSTSRATRAQAIGWKPGKDRCTHLCCRAAPASGPGAPGGGVRAAHRLGSWSRAGSQRPAVVVQRGQQRRRRRRRSLAPVRGRFCRLPGNGEAAARQPICRNGAQ